MSVKHFQATLRPTARGGAACALDFDVKDAFGRARSPVRVTINQYTFRTTTIAMGGSYFLGINKAHQAGAGIRVGETCVVEMALDEAPRVVTPPPELATAIRDDGALRAAWDALSYTHQKEHVQSIEDAKRPETRARRLAQTVRRLKAKRKK